MRDEKFVIRVYGKSELAMLYFPHMSPEGALKALKRWIKINPRLSKMKLNKGKHYTPNQVKKMVYEWGEPFDPQELNSL